MGQPQLRFPSEAPPTGAPARSADAPAVLPVADEARPAASGPAASTYVGGSGRRPALAAVVLLHVAAIAALLTMRADVEGATPIERLQVFDVAEVTEPPPPPPPPPEPIPLAAPQVQPVSVATTRATVEAPRLVRIDLPAPAPVPAPVAPVEAPVPPAPPPPVTPPDFTAAQLNNPGPVYPRVSRRNREQGVVLLRVLVTPGGGAGEVRLEQSSGFERLDEAAIATVRRWRFLPARQAGNPVAAWVIVPVTFALS